MAQLFTHTPTWVWLLLAGLCFIGYLQTKTRQISQIRLMLLPLAMMIWSLFTTYQQLGYQLNTLLVWGLSSAFSCYVFGKSFSTKQSSYDPQSGQFMVIGSWMPLILILGIFFTKYLMSVGLVMRPQLQENLGFTLSLSTLLGAFSGALLARAVGILRLRQRPSAAPISAHIALAD